MGVYRKRANTVDRPMAKYIIWLNLEAKNFNVVRSSQMQTGRATLNIVLYHFIGCRNPLIHLKLVIDGLAGSMAETIIKFFQNS